MLHLLLEVTIALCEAASEAIQAPEYLIFGRIQISFSLNNQVFQADYFHLPTHSF